MAELKSRAVTEFSTLRRAYGADGTRADMDPLAVAAGVCTLAGGCRARASRL